MKNPFLEPPKKAVEEVPVGISIDGTFVCMTCGFCCDEAQYFPVEKLLVWFCEEEHKSYIENFTIGA